MDDGAHIVRSPRVACDVMLGKLARWLRLLGVDTAYARDWNEATICALAHREHRLLVTRSARLVRRHRVPPYLLLQHNEPFEQLASVCGHLAVRPKVDVQASRCTHCNSLLRPLRCEEAADLVFPYVRESARLVLRCDACARSYWQGTHFRRIETILGRLRKRIGSADASAR